MQQIGFDNDKYLKMQSEHIQHRIAQFDNKLYLELGGKLFDDYPVSYTHLYQSLQLMNKLRMFDWNREFTEGKFDAIIGNPPYIRVQNMVCLLYTSRCV